MPSEPRGGVARAPTVREARPVTCQTAGPPCRLLKRRRLSSRPRQPARANYGAISSANANPFAARALHEAPRPPQGLLDTETVPTTLRKTQSSAPAEASPVPASGASATTSAIVAAPSSALKLRSSPRVLRLWIAPWEDHDGDLHDASFVHVVIDTGRWLIDRVRPAPRSRLDIATPPLASTTATGPAVYAKSPADLAPTEP